MSARLSVSLHAVSVRRGGKWALYDISLSLKAGGRWALIGDNGSGKTQLLKLLAALVWPTPTGREQRIYRVGRREADLIEAKRRMVYIGGELQDKYTRYGWDLPVHDLIATGLQQSDLLLRAATSAERRRIEKTLRACAASRIVGSPRYRTDRGGSRCWRARWSKRRIGCCWTSSITVWTPTIANASTGSSTPRAPPASPGS
jgi:ABC-type molybdenum transport system ATPase subunit/photorepair protein PhrA